MSEEAKKRMWDINHRANLGCDINQEDKDFFNAYYDIMLEELEDNYITFRYHAKEF